MIAQTGVELLVGIPGSGKSLVAVRRMLRVLMELRRPVYTNMPLRWRVLHRWLHLKGGAHLAGLLRPLTEDAFNRFLERFAARHEFLDKLRTEGGYTESERVRLWHEHAGPDVDRGPAMNWIPAASVIIIDEVHHWYGNPAIKAMARKAEPPALMTYLTMHRHMLHWVWFMSQAPRQLSMTVKSLAGLIWEIRNKSEERLVWGVRFKDLGISALAYGAFTPLAWNDGDPKEKPSEDFVLLPWAPWVKWLFRLYDSHTHAGSLKQLERELKKVREEVGADRPVEVAMSQVVAKRRGSRVWWLMRKSVKFALLAFALFMAYAAGSSSAPPGEVAPAATEGSKLHEKSEPDRSGMCAMVTSSHAVIGGERVPLGAEWRGLALCYVDPAAGAAVAFDRHADRVWVFRVGSSGRCVGSSGSVAEVCASFGGAAGLGALAP